MDDVVLYTAYYSPYHVRAAEAAALPSISRKGQGLVCAFLLFGATCGMSTVAVGFLAHNPAVIWPVVAVGLVGVVVGLILAHWKATGCGMWGSLPFSRANADDSQQEGAQAAGEATMSGGSDCQGGRYYLPMYCADALDVEMGVVQQSYLAPPKHPQPPTSTPLALPEKVEVADEAKGCNGTAGLDDGGTGGESYSVGCDSSSGSGALGTIGQATAAPVAAAEYGMVMCGFPLARADGWIDTRPVLVLQPHSQMVLQPQSLHPELMSSLPCCSEAAAYDEAPEAALPLPPPPPPEAAAAVVTPTL